MLSILIPVYNFNITSLVKALHQQCEKAEIVYEILCFDDGSDEIFKNENKVVGDLANVIYKELPQNLGRSKIRNELSKAARYDYLLFMDCDSKVVSENYIKNYIDNLDPTRLLYGGRVYQTDPPEAAFYFHWFYGTYREQMPVKLRRMKPYHSFMTNNFLIPKSIFLDFLFDENLTQYGHEDTLFGLQLKQAQIPILHLENPLKHEGLETTDNFLKKTQQGIENLMYLSQINELIDTKLLRTFKAIKNWGLTYMVSFVFRLAKNYLIRNFQSQNINLRFFDFYKLGLLTEVYQKTKPSSI
jgi:glycosyltransferase involved in cell wall biosynthesis